jgi:protein arginine kinase activator
MKCEKCGNNEATYYYKTNVNGKVTEKHLCADCAAEYEREDETYAGAEEMFRRMERMTARMFSRPLFDWGFGGFMLPTFVLSGPGLLTRGEEQTETADTAEPAAAEKAEAPAVTADETLSRRREINVLREQMRRAAVSEEYEEAARLRDRIRDMERELGEI